MSSNMPAIPAPCRHDPIRLSHSLASGRSPLPSEFKCGRCGVRWFAGELSLWDGDGEAIEAIETQMGFFEGTT